MAYSYRFLDEARNELDCILSFLTMSSGPAAARSFLDELEEKIGFVYANPTLFGLSRLDELAALGYRSFFVKTYVVLCFFRGEQIFLAHIFHQRQDYARLV